MKVSRCAFISLAIAAALILSNSSADVIKTSDGTGADTYVNYFGDNSNYGSDIFIRMNKNYVGYLKFDLSSIGPNTVTDANLALYGTPIPASPPGYDYDFPVYGLLDGSDDWGESTIKYNNAPLVSNPIVRHPLMVHLGWLDYTDEDTSAITMRHAGGRPLDSFLTNHGPDGDVTIILGSDRLSYYYQPQLIKSE